VEFETLRDALSLVWHRIPSHQRQRNLSVILATTASGCREIIVWYGVFWTRKRSLEDRGGVRLEEDEIVRGSVE